MCIDVALSSIRVFCRHQEELNALEGADPEFFQFLKENDADLLSFGKREIEALEEVDAPRSTPLTKSEKALFQ